MRRFKQWWWKQTMGHRLMMVQVAAMVFNFIMCCALVGIGIGLFRLALK